MNRLTMNDIDRMYTGTPKKYTINKDENDKCKFYTICNYYQKNSKTCNNSYEKEWEYCGKYKEIVRLIS